MKIKEARLGMGIVLNHDHDPAYAGDFGEIRGIGETPDGVDAVLCAFFWESQSFYKASFWLPVGCVSRRKLS